MINVTAIQAHVFSLMKQRLSPLLTYHNLDHTLDVTCQCMDIAKAEGITDVNSLLELQIACIYHDVGFLSIYTGHEEKGCEMARAQLPGFGVNSLMIDHICEIIMATKIPQSPKNHLQQIICDADLDYLGREDFFTISDRLCEEILAYKLAAGKKEFKERQVDFLQSHTYFTKSSQTKRGPGIARHLQKLMADKSIAL
jgi:hypothetical protein